MKYGGFTLIELIIVIAIMGVMAFTVFANIGMFREDQTLKKGVSDLQTSFRAIQTNATSNTKCHDNASSWKGRLAKAGTTYKLETICQYSGSSAPIGCTLNGGVVECITRTLNFDPNLEIRNVDTNGTCRSDNLATTPVSVAFAPLSGKITFEYPTSCTQGSQMEIDLINTKSPGTLNTVTIDSGGVIYVNN